MLVLCGGFPKLGIPSLGIPLIRTAAFGGLNWGLPLLGQHRGFLLCLGLANAGVLVRTLKPLVQSASIGKHIGIYQK